MDIPLKTEEEFKRSSWAVVVHLCQFYLNAVYETCTYSGALGALTDLVNSAFSICSRFLPPSPLRVEPILLLFLDYQQHAKTEK